MSFSSRRISDYVVSQARPQVVESEADASQEWYADRLPNIFYDGPADPPSREIASLFSTATRIRLTGTPTRKVA